MENKDELSPNQLFAEKLAINDEVGGENLAAGTSSGTVTGQIGMFSTNRSFFYKYCIKKLESNKS